MSDEAALLDTVLRDPVSDAPRLAYAAWLRQAGGAANLARAEFIQLQIEIEQLADDERRWPELARRERELLMQWRSVWEKPLRDLLRPSLFRPARWLRARLFGSGGAWRFHRGFIEEIDTTAAGFLEEDAILFGRAPIRRVVLATATGLIDALTADSRLDGLASLHLIADAEFDEEMEGLRQAANAQGLAVLEMRFPRIEADAGDLLALLRTGADEVPAQEPKLSRFRSWAAAGPCERDRLRELARQPRFVQRLTEPEHFSHAELLRINDWLYLGNQARDAGAWAVVKTFHDLEDENGFCRRLILFKKERINREAFEALQQSPHCSREAPA
jgi:uncharacterized protein (TIGR02996 family)